MKQVINGLIGLVLMLVGMLFMLLAFYTLAWSFGDYGWYLPEGLRVTAGIIGFVFGIYLCVAYFHEDN